MSNNASVRLNSTSGSENDFCEEEIIFNMPLQEPITIKAYIANAISAIINAVFNVFSAIRSFFWPSAETTIEEPQVEVIDSSITLPLVKIVPVALHFSSMNNPFSLSEMHLPFLEQTLLQQESQRITQLIAPFNLSQLNEQKFPPSFFKPTPAYTSDYYHQNDDEFSAWFNRHNPSVSAPNLINGQPMLAWHPETNADKLGSLSENLDIDDRFICAITKEIMTYPVYDRNNPHQKMDFWALEKWVKDRGTHPFNRSPLDIKDLVNDSLLKTEIDGFVSHHLASEPDATPSHSI